MPHAGSYFVTGQLLARIGLSDRDPIRRTADGGKREMAIEDATTLERVLRVEIGIDTERMAGLSVPG